MDTFAPPIQKKKKLIDRLFSKIHSLRASDAFILKSIFLIAFVFLLIFLIQLSQKYSVSIATSGGTFTEGIVGTPRFINPVLAVTRADKDLTTLIYDGLMVLGKDGTLVPSVAQSITVSEDGLTYNIILKNNITFHDGTPLKAADVAFTIGRIQDPLLASPLRTSFDGIVLEEVGEYEINLILPESYAPFIQNLTFGILPQHIWENAGTEEFPFSQYNSEPVGSGPYQIKDIVRNASGIPEKYILKTNTAYHTQAPKIETVELDFFPTDEKLAQAFINGEIDSIVGIDEAYVEKLALNPETHHLERIPLPRTFALFMNQNKSPALRDSSARRALSVAIDRTALISATLGGYGNPLTSPIPPGFGITETAVEIPTGNIEEARDILKKGGWKLNAETQILEKTIDGTLTPLSFSISTANSSVFETTAEFLRTTWKEIGAEVSIKQFEQSDLTQSVIRPRDYETLLFGTQLGRSLDFYSFWHSSQRNDPGLNIALYANITTDSILSDMRRTGDEAVFEEAVNRFAAEIKKETPAIFLFAPELLYVFPNRVLNATFTGVSEPRERWNGIDNWYIKTEAVWPFFTK